MANIMKVAAEKAQAEAEVAALAAAQEAQAQANVVELLEVRSQFEQLRKGAVTLLANIDLANAYFDRNVAEDRELSLEDTEALLLNFETVEQVFGGSLAAVSEEYDALKAQLQSPVCDCRGCMAEAA